MLTVCVSLFVSQPSAVWASPTATPAAGDWKAILGTHQALPPRLIAVDKDKQQIMVFQGKNKHGLNRSYVCTTGQRIGDKQVQGDLKTPEGIYFVVQHLNSGLDFAKYGYEAYTLNYPNPVDRLHKKTGYGIWIHGRGETIKPLITQGCVALNNDDLKVLGNMLTPGTPVALTNSLAHTPKVLPQDAATAAKLVSKVEGWAKAWGGRSTSMFDFYDQDAYSIAQGESFSQFRKQKERLFKSLPWIKTSVHDVQAFKGPGYWVTWFYQNYEAPNLSTNGIRRLYWKENAKGELYIVGMEWLPGLSTGSYLADAEPATPPSQQDMKSEEQAEPIAETNLTAPVSAETTTVSTAATRSTLQDTPEEELVRPELALALYKQGALVVPQAQQPEPAVLAEQASLPVVEKTEKNPETTTALLQTLPPPLPTQGLQISGLTQPAAEPVLVALGPGRTANDAAGIMPSPAVQESPPPAVATLDMVTVEPPTTSTAAEQAIYGKTPARSASLLAANTTTAGTPPQSQPEEISSEEKLTISVFETVDEWAKAWEQGDIEWYMEFYLTGARQGAIKSADSIRKQKIKLWQTNAPKKVRLEDMEIAFSGDTVTVRMKQTYADKTGKGDKGIKTLILERVGNMWFIANEQWSPS